MLKETMMKSAYETEIPQMPKTIGYTSPQAALLSALAADPARHPERSHATLARVTEVIEILCNGNGDAGALASKCVAAAGPGHGLLSPVSNSTAAAVATVMANALAQDQLERAIELLWQSELSTDEVIALHKKYKIPVSHLEDDLLPVKGDGALIFDSKGQTFIDLDSNYSATNLGNANPEIALGLFNQASILVSQKEDRIQVARARFLKEFHGILPDGLQCFYWQNSGGEAVDKSLKIAKAYTGHTGVVAFEGGFHGRTHGAVAVTHNPAYRTPFGLDDVPWVHFAEFGDLDAVRTILEEGSAKTVILELVQGEEAGIRPAGSEFAQGLRALCDEHNALLIVDEVQTGFGRVADGPETWFASQLFGIEPDIMAIGKSFGGGYPVTAVVTRPHVSAAMRGGYDGSTFGGNPMAMTAALIATRQMKKLHLPAVTAVRGARFADQLHNVTSPLIGEIRVIGLMIGIDLPSKQVVAEVQKNMMSRGVHSSLSTGSTLRWMPPLVITDDQVDTVVSAFAESVKTVEPN